MNYKTITEIKRLLAKEIEEKEKAIRDYAKYLIEKYGEDYRGKFAEEERKEFAAIIEECVEITKVQADYCESLNIVALR